MHNNDDPGLHDSGQPLEEPGNEDESDDADVLEVMMASINQIQNAIPETDDDVHDELQVLTATAQELREDVQARGFYKTKFTGKGSITMKGGKR